MTETGLLTISDTWTPAAERALREIFARFDVDKDGALSPAEVDDFAVATNGEKFSEDTHSELTTYFECTDDGKLTLEGFMDMYHLQTLSDEAETWKDLRKLGYDDQLIRAEQ
ncbi:uncharacterized protein EV422DRAFT_567574 [Fimicolochytrium jonesii]|uniref:uncharacterized protein n=1 Tax=Fimicolochytrium jonesii TaxID=1396493 RepID=UPI0022FEFB6D|nr:uncharacterized protein EV422DRAFT_567574 [Fimicolochytrium jonesii]KAI8820679.1 hypothetical protein EV422DRAFT_567574 [Fimicolochytrium jonesii]